MNKPSRIPSRYACVLVLWLAAPGAFAADEPKPEIVRFVSTWGKQGTAPGEFDFPIGIAINAVDEVFVTDHYNDRVQKFDADGKLLRVFPVLPRPGGIAVDKEGNIYLGHFPRGAGRADAKAPNPENPDRLSVYSADGTYLRQWGKKGTGDGEFSWVGGLAFSPQGEIFVADQNNRRVQVFDLSGKFLRKWGERGDNPGQFGGTTSHPKSRTAGPDFVALDSAGNAYTTESFVGRVQKFTPQGEFLLLWGGKEDKPGSFGGVFTGMEGVKSSLAGPVAICVDSHDRIWVSAVCGRVQLFSSKGEYLGGFGAQGTGNGQFFAPHGIAVNHRGQLYVVDAYNHRVQKFEVLR
jgi:DNA-binding beta-propeller fold protein YncE